jgi:hypothetical protein
MPGLPGIRLKRMDLDFWFWYRHGLVLKFKHPFLRGDTQKAESEKPHRVGKQLLYIQK